MTKILMIFIVLAIFTFGICAMRIGGGIEAKMKTNAAEKAAWGRIDRQRAETQNKAYEKERAALSPHIQKVQAYIVWALGVCAVLIIGILTLAFLRNTVPVFTAYRVYHEDRLRLKAMTIYPDRKTLQLPVIIHESDGMLITFNAQTGERRKLYAGAEEIQADPMQITATTSVKNQVLATQQDKRSVLLNA